MQVENVIVESKECGSTFQRTNARKSHKCLAERAKPVTGRGIRAWLREQSQ